jgi:hypothetical protein
MMKFLIGLVFATLFVANAFAFVCPNGKIPPGYLVETCSDDDSHDCVRGHSDGLLVAWEHAEGKGPLLKWGNLVHKCDYDFKLLGIYQVDANGVFIDNSLTDFDEFDWTICKPDKNGHVVTVDIFGELRDEDEADNDDDMDIFMEIIVVKSPHAYFFDLSFELDHYHFPCHDMAKDIVWAALFDCDDDDPGHSDDHHHKDDCPLDIDLIVCSELAQYTYIPLGSSSEVTVDVLVRFSDNDNGNAGFFLIFGTGNYQGAFVSLKFDARFEVPKKHH